MHQRIIDDYILWSSSQTTKSFIELACLANKRTALFPSRLTNKHSTEEHLTINFGVFATRTPNKHNPIFPSRITFITPTLSPSRINESNPASKANLTTVII